ncbi:MAG: ribonuclease HI [Woeseia sp.]|nr:ribonuclease HI [Woeseia sp.]
MTQIIKVYTDGACRGNPGPGGWGVLLIDGNHEKTLHGGELNTTNNRMELTAAIKALHAVNSKSHIVLYTDSKYVMDGINNWIPNWKKRGWKTAANKPVKNKDLWQKLDDEVTKHIIDWHWVKGHDGNRGNEMADELANKGIDEL